MVDCVACVDGLVVMASTATLPGYKGDPIEPRYDRVDLLDDQGWFYRYSHLIAIDPAIKPGVRVRQGQKVGTLGKEGSSGGWSHLHFAIQSRQPSGNYGIQAAYAFCWEAYVKQYAPKLIAVARPHHLAWAGEKVTLDGTRSWSASGKIARYDWTFADGTKASGPTPERTYDRPGQYSEVLKVTDGQGNVAYDFAIVQILDKAHPDQIPPTMQAAYAPSLDIKPGDPVTFKVRSFRTTDGEEKWDFGDGSAPVTVKSDGCVKALAKDGFAITRHRFEKPGDYLVRVERANKLGHKAMANLYVRVDSR
jgi:hypothetical protein